MNLPNTLTVIRILLVPVFAFLIVKERTNCALLVFLTASITDGLDGYIARTYGLKSRLGAFLDPLADKLLLLTSYLLLSGRGDLPLWLTHVVVGRDVVILSGIVCIYLVNHTVDFSPTWTGKITTFIQLVTLLLVLLKKSHWPVSGFLLPLYLINLFITLLSGVHYVYLGFRQAGIRMSSLRGRG